jgi:hypothetical protein
MEGVLLHSENIISWEVGHGMPCPCELIAIIFIFLENLWEDVDETLFDFLLINTLNTGRLYAAFVVLNFM